MCMISYFVRITPVLVCMFIHEVCADITDLIIHVRIRPLLRTFSFIPRLDRLLRVFRYSQVKAMYASSKDRTVSFLIISQCRV